jgi:hypothetical protein
MIKLLSEKIPYNRLAEENLAAQFEFAAVFLQGIEGASSCYTTSMS